MMCRPSICLAALLALSSCRRDPTTPSGELLSATARPLPVEVVTIHPVDGYELSRTYTGEVFARQVADLGFEVKGRIQEMAVDVGARVEKGAVLARVDADRLVAGKAEMEARLEQAQAALAEMKAGPRKEVIQASRADVAELRMEVRLAGLQLQRRRDLLKKEVASQEDIDVAETRLLTVEARLAGAQSRLAELEAGTRPERITAQTALVRSLRARLEEITIDIADCELKAPFAGTVATRHFDPGVVVEPGRPVMRLVETGHLEAWIGVPSRKPPGAEGRSMSIEVNGLSFDATAMRVLPELDVKTRTSTWIFELPPDAAARGVRAGEVARLRVTSRVSSAGFWLPMSSLTESNRGLWSCYVLGERRGDAYVVRRAIVEVLHVTVDRALVRGTLVDGDRVLDGGTQRVVPGQMVAPRDRP